MEMKKKFLCLKIAEIDMGVGQLWVVENDFGHKTHVFKLKPFFRGKKPNSMTRSLLQRKLCDAISQKVVQLPHSNFASDMLLWL